MNSDDTRTQCCLGVSAKLMCCIGPKETTHVTLQNNGFAQEEKQQRAADEGTEKPHIVRKS